MPYFLVKRFKAVTKNGYLKEKAGCFDFPNNFDKNHEAVD